MQRNKYDKMPIKLIIIIVLLLIVLPSNSQQQAGNIYEFLDMPTTAQSVAIGGNQVVSGTDNAGFFFQNPAILQDTLNGSVSLNICPLPSNIFYGTVSYVYHFNNIGTVAAGIQYINYGEFERTDENWNELGTFRAQETALYFSYARQMTPTLHLGATIKPILSTLDNYKSFGLAMDMGAYYRASNNLFQAGLVIRNVGGQITTYDTDSKHESLNTDMRIGMSYKLEHAPFRFSATLKDIFHWDLSTNNSNKISTGDNIMRHLLLGIEFMPIRNFYVGFGYDQRKRKELRQSTSGGAAGFSWGFGLRIFKIDIAYGYGKYHIAGASNNISISTNIGRFL